MQCDAWRDTKGKCHIFLRMGCIVQKGIKRGISEIIRAWATLPFLSAALSCMISTRYIEAWCKVYRAPLQFVPCFCNRQSEGSSLEPQCCHKICKPVSPCLLFHRAFHRNASVCTMYIAFHTHCLLLSNALGKISKYQTYLCEGSIHYFHADTFNCNIPLMSHAKTSSLFSLYNLNRIRRPIASLPRSIRFCGEPNFNASYALMCQQ